MITSKSDVENSFWNLSIEEACHTLAVGPKGIEDSEVTRRLKQNGPNTLKIIPILRCLFCLFRSLKVLSPFYLSLLLYYLLV